MEHDRSPMAGLKSTLFRVTSAKADRFSQRNAWLRIVVLGTLLMYFAALSGTQVWNTNLTSAAGLALVASGILIAFIMCRLAYPTIYWDWMLMSGAMIVLGVLVSTNPILTSLRDIVAFSVMIAFVGATRVYVGMTHSPRSGGHSIIASGAVTFLCLIWTLTSHTVAGQVNSAVITATDLMFSAWAILAWGISIRPRHRN